MKKFATVAAIGVLAIAVAPMASAVTDEAWNPRTLQTAGPIQVLRDDAYSGGGWCNNGTPASAIALHSADGKSHTVYLAGYDARGHLKQRVITVTSGGDRRVFARHIQRKQLDDGSEPRSLWYACGF